MSSTGASASTDTSMETQEVGSIDMKLEVVTLPVSDVERAKRFYQSLGWRLDADIVVASSGWSS
jgi:predicted enzyme related to lactoylglutathione lyase